MPTAEEEFHEFVSGFADPLSRLAFLLTARSFGSDDEQRAHRLAASALARARRRWRDVRLTGAPEPIAVEALLAQLPRSRRGSGSDPAQARPLAPPPSQEERGDEAAALDVRLVHEAAWRAWVAIEPRQRVPLLFADASVASRRLAGLDVPESFGSPRRQDALAAAGLAAFESALHADTSLPPAEREFVDGLGEAGRLDLLARTLEESARQVAAPLNLYPVVLRRLGQMRWRAGGAVAAATALAVALAVVVVNVSAPSKPAATEAASSLNAAVSGRPAAPAGERIAGRGFSFDWPTRGTLKDDKTLIASARTLFALNHADVVEPVRVLLATETKSFRLVYVLARSTLGVAVEGWYYAPPGSADLVEGSYGYVSPNDPRPVIARAVFDPTGHGYLVVIGPPKPADVSFSMTGPSGARGADRVPVPDPDGLAVTDITNRYVPSLRLDVRIGASVAWAGGVDQVQLAGVPQPPNARPGGNPPASPAGPASSASAASPAGPASSAPASGAGASLPVERGSAEPQLVAQALLTMRSWERTGALGGAQGLPVVLWGGADDSGNHGVVLRARTLHLSDLAVVVWAEGGDAASSYRLVPDAPDFPIAFLYDSKDHARVGVIVPSGVTQVGLVVNGADFGVAQVDPTGFASLLVGHQYGLLAEQTLAVDMFDAHGRQLGRVPVLPQV